MNELTILFQRCGFTRDTADYIRRNKNTYIQKVGNEYKIKNK